MAKSSDELEQAAQSQAQQAGEKWDDIKDSAAEAWDKTKRTVGDKAGDIHRYAKQNPWQVAAISAGIGLLVGTLLMRRRNT